MAAKDKSRKSKGKSGKDKKNKRGKKGKPSAAKKADRHALYQKAVQEPSCDIGIIERFFEKHRGRSPRSVKEDFCGTALFCAEWVESNPERIAVGVDLDQPTLDWGEEHNLSVLEPSDRSRITIHCDDVRKVTGPPVDVVCALNYSYCVFKRRADLVA
ncbi:MAG: class I SAM-dependent methyltransferase, partial [Myxococcota bacterium]